MTLTPPAIYRNAPVPTGAVFLFAGRLLMVERVVGEDAAAPVICRELGPAGQAEAGQLALWCAAAVSDALAGRWR